MVGYQYYANFSNKNGRKVILPKEKKYRPAVKKYVNCAKCKAQSISYNTEHENEEKFSSEDI